MNEEMNIATQFNGTFDLQFLRRGERVRSAGKDTEAIEITTPTKVIRVTKGDWVIRKIGGDLIVHSELP